MAYPGGNPRFVSGWATSLRLASCRVGVVYNIPLAVANQAFWSLNELPKGERGKNERARS